MSVEPVKMNVLQSMMEAKYDGKMSDEKQGLYSLAWYLWHEEDAYDMSLIKTNRIMGRTQYVVEIKVGRPVVAEEIHTLKGKSIGYEIGDIRYSFEFPALGKIIAMYSEKGKGFESEVEENLRTEFARMGANSDSFLKNATVEKPYMGKDDDKESVKSEASVESKPAPAPAKKKVDWRVAMTVVQMRELLKTNGKSGYSGKSKAELIKMIEDAKLKEEKKKKEKEDDLESKVDASIETIKNVENKLWADTAILLATKDLKGKGKAYTYRTSSDIKINLKELDESLHKRWEKYLRSTDSTVEQKNFKGHNMKSVELSISRYISDVSERTLSISENNLYTTQQFMNATDDENPNAMSVVDFQLSKVKSFFQDYIKG